MKAWCLHGINDLRFEEVSIPSISEKEVLVKIKGVGICGSDIPRVYKEGAHNMPLIIGHEFSGEVVKIGKQATHDWLGKRVGVFPLIPCKQCNPCNNMMYEMCRNYSYLGSRQNGGFAEYVAVPEWNLISLAEGVSYEEAAMLEPMSVAVHAIRKAMPTKEDKVVVCGLGTIGTLLTMFLKEIGIDNILVIGNKEFQKKNILKLGISEENYCDYKKEDAIAWILKKTNANGTDIFFECVGKEETYNWAIETTTPAGKVCLVGNPYGQMNLPQKTYWKILRNQLSVLGTWNSSFSHEENDDWHYVLNLLKNKKINPSQLISHKFSLEDIYKGFEIMRDKKEDYLKIMAINE